MIFPSRIFAARLGAFSCLALALVAAAIPGARAQQEVAFKLADARPGDVRLFVAGSMLAPVLSIQGKLEQATGHKVVIESTESRLLQKEIEAGQPFEAALLTTNVMKDMVAKGKIIAGSDVIVAAVRVGVSVRGDAPKLDITTPEGLKSAILGAHSVRRYFGVAASVPILDNLFAKLGLSDFPSGKIVRLGEGPIPAEAPLPAGQYEVIINLISAIKPMKGWTYLGPIPEQFQMPVNHSAGQGASGDPAAGQKVMAVIKGPDFQAALKASGITGQ